MTETVKRVYAFGKDAQGNNVTEGNTDMKAVLGGKGANLAEMANIGLPVPPGFTITCQTCMEYANAGNVWPEGALTPSTITASTSRRAWARRSATPKIRCSCPFARAPPCRCPA